VSFRLLTPETEGEALALLTSLPEAERTVLSGGTDLLLDLEFGRLRPASVVSLRKLPWREMAWEDGALRVGSLRPLADIERDPEVARRIPGFWSALRAVGSLALRHRATLGGNLARAAPASDLLPILLALDAEIETVGTGGRRRIGIDPFILGSRRTSLAAGELIRSVRVPAAPSVYLWQRVRPANDVSQIGVAVARGPDGRWRIAVGGISPRPIRLPGAEAALSSTSPSPAEVGEASTRAAREAPFPTDKRATEAYRRHLVAVLVARAIDRVGSSA
jgi:CO/xanthine dehydrogenase FAD-binding subunit